ncbi:Decaprenyl diphosphate synthase-like protein [Lipomyces oligophaga]|uniref:Decaprenyl diphosphate synthase-like protein n=1 Tax=Lipomyces oligophaga TaxID=45792 RepID=UPI0034CD6277
MASASSSSAQQIASESITSLNPRTGALQRGRELVVNKLIIPLGHRSIALPSNIFEHLRFQIFHAVLVVLHLLVAIQDSLARHYYTAKNGLLAFLYHHHRTPQLIAQDMHGLAKTPTNVAIILTFRPSEEGGGIQGLMEQVADVVSWSLGSSIKALTVYESSGQLLTRYETAYQVIERTLVSYYGAASLPRVRIHVPHTNTIYVPPSSSPDTPYDIDVYLISKDDGRQFLVDLTREYAFKAAVHQDFEPSKLTVESIDKIVSDRVIPEPDLIILFGPSLDLDSFPPWPARLSEIYFSDFNNSVTYSVFLRGIRRYSDCQINIGR